MEFDPDGFEDLAWWIEQDRKKALRISELGKGKRKPAVPKRKTKGKGKGKPKNKKKARAKAKPKKPARQKNNA